MTATRRTGGGNTSSGEIDDGQTLQPRGFLQQMERGLNVFGVGEKLLLAHHAGLPNFRHDSTLVAHGLDNVASAGFTLGADESGTFGDPTESFAQILRTANKRNLVCVLVNVMFIIRGCENLRLVDVIDSDGLQDLQKQ